MTKDTLTITDNRTSHSYEVPILCGTYAGYGAAIRGDDLRQIKASENDFGLLNYDPAARNTTACRSAITLVDGDRGILRYRGYPIEELAEQSTYVEVASLLLRGELPDREQLDAWPSGPNRTTSS